jgi:hypothetical protein
MNILTSQQAAFLRQVAKENVTWHARSYRVWTSETGYRTETPLGKDLYARGAIIRHPAAGYVYANKGPVELTIYGQLLLEEYR